VTPNPDTTASAPPRRAADPRSPRRPLAARLARLLLSLVVVFSAGATLSVAPASASKQIVDYFGTDPAVGSGTLGGEFTDPQGVAVNQTGAGGVPAGTVYVVDHGNDRIQRFSRDTHGTPTPYDDTYPFVSAWGPGVLDGSTTYQICTIASACRAGVASAGNGGLSIDGNAFLSGIAIDQDTGELYASDPGNNRVDVYAADGAFLRSFGEDVVASGPDDAGTGYELCVAATGDLCKVGTAGSATGQIAGAVGIAISPPDGNPATGTVYLADEFNGRVDTYALDGSSPGSIGSPATFKTPDLAVAGCCANPKWLAVDSRGILYASNGDPSISGAEDPRIERYDTQNADGGGVGFLAPLRAPVDELQYILQVGGGPTSGTFRLSFDPDGGGPQPPETTTDLPYNASKSPGQIASALEALPSIGPGNVSATAIDSPITGPRVEISFRGALAHTDLSQLVLSNGSTPLSPSGSLTVATARDGHTGVLNAVGGGNEAVTGLAVDPDSDGAGPDSDVLYAYGPAIQQFGPANPPGLTSPPAAGDDLHGDSPPINQGHRGLALDESDGRLYATGNSVSGFAAQSGHGVYVLDNAGPAPTASLDSLSDLTPTTVTAHATIDPNGPPLLSYHLEYSTDGSTWTKTPEVVLGTQDTPQSVTATLDPPAGGLEPATHYFIRLAATKAFTQPVVTSALEFDTPPAPPDAETTGAALPGPTGALLGGRLDPRNSATTYHFDYGTAGPCDSSPCASTPDRPAGSGDAIELLSEPLTGLQPDTTYHYRLTADNGTGGPALGADRTLHTPSAQPLSHGHFPGPPGSDRAWEQVSIPDSGGNPVAAGLAALGFSASGDRALYTVAGGTPISPSGTAFSQLLAQRPPGQHPTSGWASANLVPRSLFAAPDWFFQPNPGLTQFLGYNTNAIGSTPSDPEDLWRLAPGGPYQHLSHNLFGRSGSYFDASDDLSRVLTVLQDDLDPAHPADPNRLHLYDVSDGTPRLLDLLPSGAVPACGVASAHASDPGPRGGFQGYYLGGRRWLSADGSLALFPSRGDSCSGPVQLYLRDLPAAQTTLLSGPPLSGPACSAYFIRATATAVFFATQTRLVSQDTVAPSCSNDPDARDVDVYRYDLGGAPNPLDCVTCLVPGRDADVYSWDNQEASGSLAAVGVSRDGSAVYFHSPDRLLPGAPATGGIYRADVPTHQLAYVAPSSLSAEDVPVGDALRFESAVSADGSVLVFRSANPALDPLGPGAPTNAGTAQYYRYDNRDRSLLCVSCPLDGSPPRAEVVGLGPAGQRDGALTAPTDYNVSPLSADGQVFAFNAPTALTGADQNTAAPSQDPNRGTDLYEWRGGRPLLVSDGLTDWPTTSTGAEIPEPASVSPSGQDVFFFADAAYTPDALDNYRRLYDARLGGGIDFPPTLPPCPLDACQGNPSPAPTDPASGSSTFTGPSSQGKSRSPAAPTRHKKHCKRHHKCKKKGHKK
jgi:hypothetical protein